MGSMPKYHSFFFVFINPNLLYLRQKFITTKVIGNWILVIDSFVFFVLRNRNLIESKIDQSNSKHVP